VNRPHFELL